MQRRVSSRHHTGPSAGPARVRGGREGGGEAVLPEHRRVEAVGEVAHLVMGGPDVAPQAVQRVGRVARWWSV